MFILKYIKKAIRTLLILTVDLFTICLNSYNPDEVLKQLENRTKRDD